MIKAKVHIILLSILFSLSFSCSQEKLSVDLPIIPNPPPTLCLKTKQFHIFMKEESFFYKSNKTLVILETKELNKILESFYKTAGTQIIIVLNADRKVQVKSIFSAFTPYTDCVAIKGQEHSKILKLDSLKNSNLTLQKFLNIKSNDLG